jgi:hypothetical protein
MLQKSLVAPPRRAETRHFPYSVLAAFIGLNVPQRTPRFFARSGLARGKARLGAPGWAGEKSGLFAHPAYGTPVSPDGETSETPAYRESFSATC